MKALVVYDSVHGNTEKIAQVAGNVINGEVSVRRVGEVSPSDLKSIDLLIVGSPTHGGKPTQAIQGFLNSMPEPVSGVAVAAFDTRLSAAWVKVFGYAAERIAGAFRRKGWPLVEPVEGFFVKGRQGPLKDGEIQRAAAWAKAISTDTS